MLLLIALIEVLVSLASRRLIVARLGLLPDGAGEPTEGRLAVRGALRPVRQPLRVAGIARAVLAARRLVAIVLAVGGLSLAWGADAPGTAVAGTDRMTWARCWVRCFAVAAERASGSAALCLCGLASAFRSSLWTMDTLR